MNRCASSSDTGRRGFQGTVSASLYSEIGVAVETKQQILKVIEDLPDDAGVEDALDRLYLLYKVERGLRQADRGEFLSQEEVRERMAKWLR